MNPRPLDRYSSTCQSLFYDPHVQPIYSVGQLSSHRHHQSVLNTDTNWAVISYRLPRRQSVCLSVSSSLCSAHVAASSGTSADRQTDRQTDSGTNRRATGSENAPRTSPPSQCVLKSKLRHFLFETDWNSSTVSTDTTNEWHRFSSTAYIRIQYDTCRLSTFISIPARLYFVCSYYGVFCC